MTGTVCCRCGYGKNEGERAALTRMSFNSSMVGDIELCVRCASEVIKYARKAIKRDKYGAVNIDSNGYIYVEDDGRDG